jgi:hypothetical protein
VFVAILGFLSSLVWHSKWETHRPSCLYIIEDFSIPFGGKKKWNP